MLIMQMKKKIKVHSRRLLCTYNVLIRFLLGAYYGCLNEVLPNCVVGVFCTALLIPFNSTQKILLLIWFVYL